MPIVPRVVISAFTRTLATIKPLQNPPRAATAKPAPTAAGTGQPAAFMSQPVTTPLSDAMAPTDKSNTPPTIISIIPTARMPSKARLRSKAEKFDADKK